MIKYMNKLSNEEQIEVLEKVKDRIVKGQNSGICAAIIDELNISKYGNIIDIHFPLFTYENAVKYGNANGSIGWYWWTCDAHKDRILFIDWMINELKKGE